MNNTDKKRKIIGLTLVLGLFLVVSGYFHEVKTGEKIENRSVSVVENSKDNNFDNINDGDKNNEFSDKIEKDNNVNNGNNNNIDDGIKYDENGEIDTSDWLTYRNEEYEFEVRIPLTWDFRYKISDKLNRKNEIYSKKFGVQKCFLILGAKGHGLNNYKQISKKQIKLNNNQFETIKRISLNGNIIQGQYNINNNNFTTIFEYYLNTDLLNSECEKNILHIVSTYKKLK